MNKTWIIIQREFINRVSKKSFILLTILMPFILRHLFCPVVVIHGQGRRPETGSHY